MAIYTCLKKKTNFSLSLPSACSPALLSSKVKVPPTKRTTC